MKLDNVFTKRRFIILMLCFNFLSLDFRNLKQSSNFAKQKKINDGNTTYSK